MASPPFDQCLRKLNDHFNIIWSPLQGFCKVFRFFNPRDQTGQPAAIRTGQELCSFIPVPLIGIYTTDNHIIV